jgi:hypothetical protein
MEQLRPRVGDNDPELSHEAIVPRDDGAHRPRSVQLASIEQWRAAEQRRAGDEQQRSRYAA